MKTILENSFRNQIFIWKLFYKKKQFYKNSFGKTDFIKQIFILKTVF